MFKFCPNCTKEVMPEWKCCPYCGYKLELPTQTATPMPTPTAPSADSSLDDALEGLMDFAGEKQAQSERRAQDDKLRVMIIRRAYDEAKAVCNERIDADPMDKAAYIGLIRIASKNYKEYEGADIDEQIRVAEEVFGGSDALMSDNEYAKYIAVRKQYFADKEQKRKEAEEAEAEQKRKEAEEAEAEQKRKEAEKAEAKRRIMAGLSELCRVSENSDGSYTIISVRDKSIERIYIPSYVTSICSRAFAGCSNLQDVDISFSVGYIGEAAFEGCGFKSVTISSDCYYYKAKDGKHPSFPDGCRVKKI